MNKKPFYFVALIIVLAAIAFSMLSGFIWDKNWYAPILMFILALAFGFGLFYLVMGLAKKAPFRVFIGAILLEYGMIYLLAFYVKLIWWVILIAAIAWPIVAVLFSLIFSGNKTESIAENDRPDYKNYEERRKEKEEKEKLEEEKPLPEIKSFKD